MLKNLTKNINAQKIISSLIVFSIITSNVILLFVPKSTEAQFGFSIVSDPPVEASTAATATSTAATAVSTGATAASTGLSAGLNTKEAIWRTIVKELLMRAGRILINKITQSTVNWINSGFHGNPFFIENPESFFKDIVKFEVKNLVDVYAYNKIKFPFGKQFALNTISSYQRQAEDNAAYTLSNIINDPVFLENYRNDFNVGGWNGFLINTQYPQNNYIGSQMIMSEQLARKLEGTVQNKAQQVQDTLQKSGGFLAPKLCLDTKADGKTPTGYNNGKNEFLQPTFDSADWEKKNPVSACGTWSSSNSEQTNKDIAACVEGWNHRFEDAKAKFQEEKGCKNLAVTTPGGVVGNQIKTALESKFHQAELSAAMGNSIAAVFDALLNVLMEKAGKGLKGLLNRPPEDVAGPATLPAGGGPGGGNTGGNGKCIDAEGVSTYNVYVDAVASAEGKAYPNGYPAGLPATTAQEGVCGLYTGPGTCGSGAQEDELVISGLPAPYVTLSIDFLIGSEPYASSALYARAVAACEEGVQGTGDIPPTDGTGTSQTQKIITPGACASVCVAAGGYATGSSSCGVWCGVAGAASGPNMDTNECVDKCSSGHGSVSGCYGGCSAAYINAGSTPPPTDPTDAGGGNQ